MSHASASGNYSFILLSAAFSAAFFAIDLVTPLGYAGGMLYVLPVVVGLWTPWRSFAPLFAVAASVLTIIGYLASPAGGVHLIVLLNRIGAVIAVWTVAIVVMRFKTTEVAALGERARLDAILDTALDGVITIDRRGMVLSYNQAAQKLFGYNAEDVVGQNVSMLMPSPHREQHDGYVERYVETREAKIIGIGRETEGLRKDQSTFPISLAVSEVKQPGASLFVGLIRDISVQKALEKLRAESIEKLERANAELERFAYTVSHDLKSPLITMKGFLGMIERDAKAGNMDRLVKDLARVSAAANKMTQLLDELLELSRIGRIAKPHANVDLGKLAAEVRNLLEGPLNDKGVELTIADDMPMVRGDRLRLQEVFQNLIENAIKFAGDDVPRIEIGQTTREGATVCYVRDNGIGIETEYLEKIFGLFDQLHVDKGGTGIGLALVKRIIEVHGGRVWVESEGIGQGATFYFILESMSPPSPDPS
jgi:two-component system sensor kinase FixL